MKKALMLGLAILISVAFVTGVLAQSAKATKTAAPKGSAKAAGSVYTGVVSSVNAESKTMTVKGKRGPVTVEVAKPAFKGYGAMSDVKQGDKVSVSYGPDSTKITKISAGKATKAKQSAQKSKKPAKHAKKKTPKT
jgi:hypothetical protein